MPTTSDQSAPPGSRKMAFRDLCPPGWTGDIWVACYRVLLVPREQLLAANLHSADLLGWRVCMLLGALPYNYPGELVTRTWDGVAPLHMDIVGSEDRITPEGAYLLLLTQYPVNVDNEDSVVGLIRLRLGRNAAFDKVFSNTLGADDKLSAWSKVAENPAWHGPPDISPARLATLAGHVDALPDVKKARLLLAARWSKRSYDLLGVDSFISLWVALEALMGSATANIKPLKTSLARIYGLSEHQVVDRLLLGPLYSLRGKVIHEGMLFGDARVLSYMQALLADLVDDMLGAPPRRLAPAMIDGVPGRAVLRAAIG